MLVRAAEGGNIQTIRDFLSDDNPAAKAALFNEAGVRAFRAAVREGRIGAMLELWKVAKSLDSTNDLLFQDHDRVFSLAVSKDNADIIVFLWVLAHSIGKANKMLIVEDLDILGTVVRNSSYKTLKTLLELAPNDESRQLMILQEKCYAFKWVAQLRRFDMMALLLAYSNEDTASKLLTAVDKNALVNPEIKDWVNGYKVKGAKCQQEVDLERESIPANSRTGILATSVMSSSSSSSSSSLPSKEQYLHAAWKLLARGGEFNSNALDKTVVCLADFLQANKIALSPDVQVSVGLSSSSSPGKEKEESGAKKPKKVTEESSAPHANHKYIEQAVKLQVKMGEDGQAYWLKDGSICASEDLAKLRQSSEVLELARFMQDQGITTTTVGILPANSNSLSSSNSSLSSKQPPSTETQVSGSKETSKRKRGLEDYVEGHGRHS
jgi:hypothetical protein